MEQTGMHCCWSMLLKDSKQFEIADIRVVSNREYDDTPRSDAWLLRRVRFETGAHEFNLSNNSCDISSSDLSDDPSTTA
jgi:hypothetical protein